MRRRTTLSAAIALAAGAIITATPAQAAPAHEGHGGQHAVFVQLNEPAGNAVQVYRQAPNGSLTAAGRYATGGKGAATAQSPVDALASQDSLVYDAAHRTLFAINAGSDTLTAFQVQGTRLVRRQVISSGGDFPVSIAVRGNLLYALNAGGDGSVQGFAITGRGLVSLSGTHRSLRLGNTTPPVFISAPAQVGITADFRHLLVTTKNHNTIEVFNLDRYGRPSAEPVANPSANPVPFAFAFTRDGVAVAEAGTSSITHYRIAADGKLTATGSVSDGQMALCWVVQANGHLYGANTGSGTISQFIVSRGGTVSLANPDGGIVARPGGAPIDMATIGAYLYVQNPAKGTVDGFRSNADGTLTPAGSVTGLPVFANGNGMEGIAAS